MENTRILIVEDEEIIRIGLKDNFELENYIVETASGFLFAAPGHSRLDDSQEKRF